MKKSLEETLVPLRAEYLSELPQRIVKLKKTLDARNFVEARDIFHNLKGTGGTYGFPEISQLSQILEPLCCHERFPETEKVSLISLAIALLKEIHLARTQSKSFLIENASDFAKILEILENYDFKG